MSAAAPASHHAALHALRIDEQIQICTYFCVPRDLRGEFPILWLHQNQHALRVYRELRVVQALVAEQIACVHEAF